jgi:hypothetical protein
VWASFLSEEAKQMRVAVDDAWQLESIGPSAVVLQARRQLDGALRSRSARAFVSITSVRGTGIWT